ncbi:MAG: hypothetical protein ACOYOU_03545 [Kiritimatiellia bacterium]
MYLQGRYSEFSPQPSQPHGTTAVLLERSLKAVTPHLPDGWQATVQALLATNPILVQVVRRRKTKHGDHQVTGLRGFSIITMREIPFGKLRAGSRCARNDTSPIVILSEAKDLYSHPIRCCIYETVYLAF